MKGLDPKTSAERSDLEAPISAGSENGEVLADEQTAQQDFPESTTHAQTVRSLPGCRSSASGSLGSRAFTPIARSAGSCAATFTCSNATWPCGQRNAGNLYTSWVGRVGQGLEGWLGRAIGDKGRLELSYRHQRVSGQFIPGGGTIYDGGS